MYLFDNPVLQRDLLSNLRMLRAFVLLFFYVGLLGLVVYVAWPSQERFDMTRHPEEAKRLVNLFFLGQYILISLLAPSFAAGAITGEKERKTYELLLASPLRPGAIVLGKLFASLCHLAVLVLCSLPIVMLCLPLGGVSLYEVLATYLAMAASTAAFGMMSVTASSYFQRTVAALLVSYLVILPMALTGVLIYRSLESASVERLVVLTLVIPGGCLALCVWLFRLTSQRLLRPTDVGAEGQRAVDMAHEQKKAVGMVIRTGQFPDRLFTPKVRRNLAPDGVNPIYDKEMRSEIFGQGTLMLRLVIQISMFLALPLMAVCLYMLRGAPWYTAYVLLFNLLVGPVFSAGSITSERERQTLELLLTTTLSPWTILWGKLLASLRISCVLTAFIMWPLLLAWLLPPWTYWNDSRAIIGYLTIIALAGLTTTVLPTFCSVLFRKSSVAMLASYLVLLLLFALPVAVKLFAQLIFPDAPVQADISAAVFTSPFAVAFSLPLTQPGSESIAVLVTPRVFFDFVIFYGALNAALIGVIIWLFNVRWRVSY